LRMMSDLRGIINLNIFGPIEDQAYWVKCERIIRQLPGNVRVEYRGALSHDRVSDALSEHDLFLFPTKGENFGHVILEALVAGCPVLLSDQTPWRGLEEKGVGWDLPLGQPELFQAALQQCVDMDGEALLAWSRRAHQYGIRCSQNDDILRQNRALFLESLDLKSAR